ncbi:MAG: DNA polymerase III subunit delta [Candidatus Omnitrophica bacterium]|nr:DNA polymerase III subunit delta [Candidatus Omnitrophota bacterium]
MISKPVFLLAGDEEFLKEEWLHNTRQRFFKDGGSNFDCDIFYADIADITGVLDIARTKPFLSKKRLIVLKNVEAITAVSRQEQLLLYARSPSLETILILESGIKEKAFLGEKFFSELGKSSEVIFFKRLYGRNLAEWINKRFLLRKRKITLEAIELLTELKGNNLKMIDEEIEKLVTYVGERSLVTIDDVQRLVGRDIRSNVYNVIDAISRNDKEKVLALTFDFQNFKDDDWSDIVGLFCAQLRKLLKARECLKKRLPLQAIIGTLELNRLNKFQVDTFIKQAKRLKSSWMKTALGELTKFDLRLKTSSLREPLFEWQMLLVRLLASL